MNSSIHKAAIAVLLGVGILALGSFLIPGCTDRLSGDQTPNQAPIVWFVNVPPEDNPSSTNPIINWVGQDIDGQVKLFRYVVLTEAQIVELDLVVGGGSLVLPLDSVQVQGFVDNVLGNVPDSMLSRLEANWIELIVDPIAGQPQTSNIVPMSAEIADPVNVYVRQYVFVQAFDELGASSPIVFRAFLRNDNPPDTRIIGFLGGPFINADSAGGTITGVRMRWQGSDIQDYPTDPPPFEFEWRLYGPYFSDTLNDSTWEYLLDNFIKPVFVTNDAHIYLCGIDTFVVDCDTSWEMDTAGDTLVPILDCDTILVDSIRVNNIYGYLDTIFDINDPLFADDSMLNRIAAHSTDTVDGDEWIWNLRDSIYGVYHDQPSDTTQENYFIFWIRSRDDAKVPDVTPAFETFSVIDPRYERDIGVIDVQLGYSVNARLLDSARAYWDRAIKSWAVTAGIPTPVDDVYIDSIDYMIVSCAAGICVTLRQMLAHKMLIIVNDNPYPGLFVNMDLANSFFTTIDAGVNVWMCGRAPVFGGEAGAPNWRVFDAISPDLAGPYSWYFGLEQKVYSGWEWYLYYKEPYFQVRVEQFIGALSLDQEKWPDLAVDTALLHRRYMWRYHYPWIDTIAALPEVNWCVRTVGTQAMYLYNSKYGNHHFLNDPNYNFQGKPVAHRLNRGFFRTVHSLFTPYSIEEATMQVTVNNILSWMYDKYLTTPPAAPRYRDAEMPVTLQEVREQYWQRMEDRARQNPRLKHYFE